MAMESEVRRSLEVMRAEYEARSYTELANLGWVDLRPVMIREREYFPSVWTQAHAGKLLLVVQLQSSFVLGWKRTDCIGSLLTEYGEIKRIDENVLMNEFGHP